MLTGLGAGLIAQLAVSQVDYNPQAAELAWKRTMEFFDKHLRK